MDGDMPRLRTIYDTDKRCYMYLSIPKDGINLSNSSIVIGEKVNCI